MATVCETPKCSKPAKLRCPTCIKLGIDGSFFCSQECFKGYWKEHKSIHDTKTSNIANGDCSSNRAEVIWPGHRFTGPLRPYEKTPKRELPAIIQRPDYADHPAGIPVSERDAKGANVIITLTAEEQEAMRKVGKLSREVLDIAVKAVKVGVTTDEIDRIVHEACVERNCYPSPLNYYRFPKSCCTSVNEVICHGIPDKRPLEDGDILNIDITVYYGGFHGDLNETVFVGTVDDNKKKLVKVAYECLAKAIEIVKPGVKYRDIGSVIQRHASANGFSVVRTYCGHGIHSLFHCPPNVPHYAKNKAIGVMKPGHCFTIEPMINAGVWRDELWPDKWTAVTQDGLPSAQFEQTMIVTETGCEIVTLRPEKNGQPHFLDNWSGDEVFTFPDVKSALDES